MTFEQSIVQGKRTVPRDYSAVIVTLNETSTVVSEISAAREQQMC
jgi:hypothetical protein